MQIEVILGYICQNSDIIPESMDTTVVQGMARGLHDEVVTSSITSPTDKIPYDKWGRCCHLECILLFMSIDNHIYCREHRYLFPISDEPFCDNIRGCCLSLSSCDSDHHHISRWVTRKEICGHSENIMVEYTDRRIEGKEFSEKMKHYDENSKNKLCLDLNSIEICIEFKERKIIVLH